MFKAKLLSLLLIVGISFATAKEVNVYSQRHYDTDKALFKTFEEQTGIKVNVVKADASALIKRIQTEGKKSPADVLLTVDAARLYQAEKEGLLQPINSKYLIDSIPANLRDSENQWFGLTKRARVVIYKIGSDIPNQLKTYEDLADPKFKGKIMVRSSNDGYNQSLLASVIANKGEEYALKWAKGVVANMTKEPKGNDRYQIIAVSNGIGEIAIANTYYVGVMVDNKEKAQAEAVKKVKILFPKFENGGTHVNITGAGVVKTAPNRDNAIKFIEFLASVEAQELFASANSEYPVVKGAKAGPLLDSWGEFQDDPLPLEKLGEYNKAAVKIFNKANWK